MISWTMSNKGRRSVYRGVSAAPLSSGRLWQAKLQLPGSLVFASIPTSAKFLIYSDDEIAAARAHDQGLIDNVGRIDASPFLNFRNDKAMTEAARNAMNRELARRDHMKHAGKTSVLRMLGRMIMSKRTLYGSKLADMRSAFDAIDIDGDGTLDRAELSAAFDRLGLGLSDSQKEEAAEVLCTEGTNVITWESYSKTMLEAKRAYAEDMKSHRTLNSLGILKPKKRYLKSPQNLELAEKGWDIRFAADTNSKVSVWDVDPDLRLDPAPRMQPLNQKITVEERKKKKKRTTKKKRKKKNSMMCEEGEEGEESKESKESKESEEKGEEKGIKMMPSVARRSSNQKEWSSIVSVSDLSLLSNAPAAADWSPSGSNTLRCFISEDMRIVAYPGSALRDGLLTDPRSILEMREGRKRGAAANYDDEETRNSDWNDRTSISASKFNLGRHTALRDYFDRPILLDKNANLQLHHRHLASRDEHVMSPVQRDRTLRSLEVGESKKSTSEILNKFRGLRIAAKGSGGLYEVRVPNSMESLMKYTLHTVHETDWAAEKAAGSIRLTSEDKHQRNIAVVAKVLHEAVKSGRVIYGKKIESIEDLFRVMDVEEDGNIDLVTFETVISKYHLGLTNEQVQILTREFDRDGDGIIEYAEMLQTFDNILFPKGGLKTTNETAQVSIGIASSKIDCQKKRDEKWRQERRKSMQAAEASPISVQEAAAAAAMGDEVLGRVPVAESTHVGFYNSTENACRAYDALVVARFGHIRSLPYMNMPETTPELWPKWQRDLYHNVTPPYLRANMTVNRPGSPAERPETPFIKMAAKSHQIRAEWRKKRDEEREKKGMPIHLKSNFIGRTPTPPIAGESTGTSPQRRARYRNYNGVWVHYNKPAIKQKQVVADDVVGLNDTTEATKLKSSVERILDNLLLAISSDRTLYGHQLTSVEDAFMAFDKEGKGSLGVPELQEALKRLGVMATRPQVKKLINNMATRPRRDSILFSEFQKCLEERQNAQDKQSLRGSRQGKKIKKKNLTQGQVGVSTTSGITANTSGMVNKNSGFRYKQEQKNLAKAVAEKKRKQKLGVQKLGELNPELLQRATLAFRDADINADGSISFPEFFQKLHGCLPSVDNVKNVRKCRELFKFWGMLIFFFSLFFFLIFFPYFFSYFFFFTVCSMLSNSHILFILLLLFF